jgi:hypothetical protein
MNKTTQLYTFFLAVSAVVLETTSAAASASPLGDKKLQQSDNFKFVAGDGRTSPPSMFLAKTSSFLSKKFKNLLSSGGGGTPDYLRPSNVDLLEPFNAAYDVSITEKFLSESEIRHYRREGSRLAIGKPAVGFSGDRTWEEVFVPRQILRRLINKGAEQCMSQEYEDTLPAGVHILTNHVKETTDPHVDYNPVTNERIENDVAVVFLNTNEDATFVVAGKYGIPIEKGKLVIFPGGSVSHHIEMNTQKEGGFVHMWGPLEVGGSHGTVGQVSRQRNLGVGWRCNWEGTTTGSAVFNPGRRRQRQRMIEEGDDTANNSSTDAEITGFVTITGYTDGIDPSGEKNNTLEVQYNLTGLPDGCSLNNLTACFYVELRDSPSCDDNNIASSLEDNGGDGDHVILNLENLAYTKIAPGLVYLNLKKPVSRLFDKPMVVRAHDGRVLACAMLTEVTYDSGDDTSGAEDIQKDDSTLSVGAIVSTSLVIWVGMVAASLMAIVAVL